MTSAPEKRYCWTCKRSIAPAWWQRHMASLGHVRRALGDPPPFVQPKTGQPSAEADPLEEDDGDETEADALDKPDTRTQCGGCSRRITPEAEYWRDDGRAYHNNCVPLETTHPLDPTQTAQAAPQQASTLVAGVGGRAQGQAKRPLPQPRPTTTSASRNAP